MSSGEVVLANNTAISLMRFRTSPTNVDIFTFNVARLSP
jgi:hypothetical protein